MIIGKDLRELKFRAFDTENKAWTFVTLGDLICGACTENGDKPLSGAKQVWEQYTGLKDKNGKEIYEGDIVLDDECGDMGEVEYYAPNFTFHPIYPIERWNSHYIGKYIKVIGNIHENPELFEVGK